MSAETSDKIQQLATQLGVSSVNKIILPDERILAKVFEHFQRLLQHPEISAIVKQQREGKITRQQMWDEMKVVAKKIDKENQK